MKIAGEVVGGLVGLFLLAWFAHDVLWRYVWFRYSVRRRHAKARAAATSAALDDAAFEPDALEARGLELWRLVQRALAERDAAVVGDQVSPALRKRIGHQVSGETGRWPVIDAATPATARIVGVVNRSGEADDRVVVVVEAQSTPPFGEFQVLGRNGDGWILFDQLEWGEGTEEFDARLIEEPAQDLDRLRDATLQELASADAIAARIRELADTGQSVEEQLLSLSGLDGRYAPAVIEASVRTLLRAWDYASFDDGAELKQRSAGVSLLGSPRRIARGARIEQLTPRALTDDAVEIDLRFLARIPRMDVPEIEQEKGENWRYHWKAQWTLALDDAPGRPWVLRAATLERLGMDMRA